MEQVQQSTDNLNKVYRYSRSGIVTQGVIWGTALVGAIVLAASRHWPPHYLLVFFLSCLLVSSPFIVLAANKISTRICISQESITHNSLLGHFSIPWTDITKIVRSEFAVGAGFLGSLARDNYLMNFKTTARDYKMTVLWYLRDESGATAIGDFQRGIEQHFKGPIVDQQRYRTRSVSAIILAVLLLLLLYLITVRQ